MCQRCRMFACFNPVSSRGKCTPTTLAVRAVKGPVAKSFTRTSSLQCFVVWQHAFQSCVGYSPELFISCDQWVLKNVCTSPWECHTKHPHLLPSRTLTCTSASHPSFLQRSRPVIMYCRAESWAVLRLRLHTAPRFVLTYRKHQ